MPAAVFAFEPGAGRADKSVPLGIALVPAAVEAVDVGAVIVAPAVVPAVIPGCVAVAVSLGLQLTLIAAGVGISGSLVLAIGVRIELRAVTRIRNDLLGHRSRARQRGGEDRRRAKNRQFRNCQSGHGELPFCDRV